MSKPFTATPHPVLGLPSPAEAMALGEAKWLELMSRREGIIAREKADPYEHGWEPPIWRLVDAIMGFPWVEAEWGEKMRRCIGLRKPVRVCLINGGNRAGKSEYASKRVMRILRSRKRALAWCLHSSGPMSIAYQQPLMFKNLPAELRVKDIRTRTTYVAYKQKTGFSEGKFVLPNESDCTFLSYEMDIKTIEGGNLDIIWADELVPPDWVKTMELRIAEKEGWMLVTFTPVQGYTETVQMFQDGAEVLREAVAYLLSKDGGEPEVARALGLTPAELEELRVAAAAQPKPRAARCPQSRPQDCLAWLEGGTGQLACPPGREFLKVPRVMRSVEKEENRAVVFFHSADNPYGNPKSVWQTIASRPQDFILERFYGVATKLFSMSFPLFNTDVHVVAPESIPDVGTNYHFLDPAKGRNFFMLWIRVTADHDYVYREWPGSDYIPGVGVPGPWAEPDGKRKDGRPGPAQAAFGFGFAQYKREQARREGWKDFAQEGTEGMEKKESDVIAGWSEHRGAKERILVRRVDSRAASEPKLERDRPKTLLTEFEDIGLFFELCPGDSIEEGKAAINNALHYDAQKPVSYFNSPRLRVSANCRNTIYALRTWTGLDGKDGATKDPIDLLRYFYLSESDYVPEGSYESAGGGHY